MVSFLPLPVRADLLEICRRLNERSASREQECVVGSVVVFPVCDR